MVLNLDISFIDNNDIKWTGTEEERTHLKNFYSSDINSLMYVPETMCIYRLSSISPLVWELFGHINQGNTTKKCKEIINTDNNIDKKQVDESICDVEYVDTYIQFKSDTKYVLTLLHSPNKKLILLDTELKITEQNVIADNSISIDQDDINIPDDELIPSSELETNDVLDVEHFVHEEQQHSLVRKVKIKRRSK